MPYVVVIAGGTCSGKSTLTDYLEAHFTKECKTLAIHMDSYFKKDPPTSLAPITGKEYVEHNTLDTLELETMMADFQKALEGDWDLVLVEGILALHYAPIREKADLKIFVDLESDARLVRRIKKHMSWGQTYEQVTDRFLESVRFRHNELVEPSRWHADLVVNGTLESNLGKEVAARYITSALKK